MNGMSFRDWQHASRLFRTDSYRYGPKYKFLYHVFLHLSEPAKQLLPSVYSNSDIIGMLVKSVELPKFTASTKTLNCYNRKKNVQTHIEYNPVSFVIHDDNDDLVRTLLEGYYRYYFADGSQDWNSGAYGSTNGDNIYTGTSVYRFGMDNENEKVPFFQRIEISQLAGGEYYMYTLINPILDTWEHSELAYAENGGIAEHRLSVKYEGVNYTQGKINQGSPLGFAEGHHYDLIMQS